jgi:hypothetical protein
MSPNILEIFAADARKYVGRLSDAVNAEGGTDIDMVRRASRRLHHAAVLADYAPVVNAAQALQKSTVQVIAGKRSMSNDLRSALQGAVAALGPVIDALPDGDREAESRLIDAVERLAGGAADVAMAPEAATEVTAAEEPTQELPVDEAEALLQGLIADLGDAIERLENDPRDREPLKVMLRKIRRLRELGRVEVLSAEDKALSAVEELILQIADLNATVGPGYLTVFRHAREVLEGMLGDAAPAVDKVGGRAVEVDRLKESVMEKVRRARQVVWVSDLFFPEGPHVVACPVAEQQAGSIEQYFLKEATQRLERSENLQKTMLESNPEQMRLAGESLAHTLRHLRERAAAFNHMALGRVTRRAAAALRAQLVKPPAQVRSIAVGLGDVLASLRAYIETDDKTVRAKVVKDAEAALSSAILGGEPQAMPNQPEFDPDAALQRALALRTRVDERLKRMSGPDADGLQDDLEELFDLIALYVSAERH